jgi:chemotaxis protein methyltransferase CheR
VSEEPVEDPEGYAFFRRKVREVLGVDLSAYKEDQMRRRIQHLRREYPRESLYALGRRLERDEGFQLLVRDRITINVSEFFRNPDRFAYLETKVLPELMRRGRLNVWSAACSIGAEPYSLAMLLAEAGGSRMAAGRPNIWATDIDAYVLEKAKRGVYTDAEVAGVPPARRVRHLVRRPEGWEVRPEVRALVRFALHDLLADPFPGPFDLIACRNVAIYFTEEARQRLYRRFVAVLPPGGVLFVGATEAILYARDIGLEFLAPSFYRRL